MPQPCSHFLTHSRTPLLPYLLGALLCMAGLLAAPARALEVADDSGALLTLPQSPQRIVSLLPSLTESVCALGGCARLVGVDTHSNFPAVVQGLPHVGGGLNPNLEAVLALRPDVVLMAGSSPAVARLQSLGLRVLALEPKTHADVQRTLLTLGRLLGVSAAPQVWQSIEDGLREAAQSLPAGARQQRVYFEVSAAPYAASESSFIGQTLQRLGLKNVVPGALGPFPLLNPEFVVRANPDVIFTSEGEPTALAQRPGWSRIRAVQAQRVCALSAAEADTVVRPGPRMAQGARVLAACVRRWQP